MSGKVKAAILIVAVIITSAVISFVSVVAVAGNSDRVFPGVRIKGIYLGDMTKEQAHQALTAYSDEQRRKTVTVRYEGDTGSFLLSDVDFKVNLDATVTNAWQLGRQGNFLAQWQQRQEMAQNGAEGKLDFSLSKEKLRTVLDEMTKGIRKPPKEAKLVFTPQNTVEIAGSTGGTAVDLDAAFSDLQNIIAGGLDPELQIRIIEVKPKQTTEDIQNLRINGLISSYTTRFDPAKVNRTYNVRVAAVALDGIIIKPGEVFSFNKVVGPRSQEAGYRMAKTILNNEFIDGLGGGVCQVSSTMYNALLQADLQVMQRSSHSLVITYAPMGQDAAVAYGYKDLVFKNNLPCAVAIKTVVSGSTVTLKIFGDSAIRKNIKIVNNIIKEYPFKTVYKDDPTLPKGTQKVDQKGSKGYKVTSYMNVYQGGKFVSRRSLSASYYKPLDQIVLVGVKPGPAIPSTGGTPEGTGTPPATTDPGGGTPSNPPATEPPPVTPPPATEPTPVTPPPATEPQEPPVYPGMEPAQ